VETPRQERRKLESIWGL